MDRSLRAHIISLELRVQELRDQLTDPQRPSREIAYIRRQVKAVELALAHYRKAYELEQGVLMSLDTNLGR